MEKAAVPSIERLPPHHSSSPPHQRPHGPTSPRQANPAYFVPYGASLEGSLSALALSPRHTPGQPHVPPVVIPTSPHHVPPFPAHHHLPGSPRRHGSPGRTPPQQPLDRTNVFVKYLPPEVRDLELFDLFQRFGRIVSAKVMVNQRTGASYGFGFVRFESPTDTANAVREMNGTRVGGKKLLCKLSNPPSNPSTANLAPSRNLYVKPLLPETTEDDLKRIFGRYGEIDQCKVMVDLATGASKRIGFVRFVHQDDATAAMTALNGSRIFDESASLPPSPRNNNIPSPRGDSPRTANSPLASPRISMATVSSATEAHSPRNAPAVTAAANSAGNDGRTYSPRMYSPRAGSSGRNSMASRMPVAVRYAETEGQKHMRRRQGSGSATSPRNRMSPGRDDALLQQDGEHVQRAKSAPDGHLFNAAGYPIIPMGIPGYPMGAQYMIPYGAPPPGIPFVNHPVTGIPMPYGGRPPGVSSGVAYYPAQIVGAAQAAGSLSASKSTPVQPVSAQTGAAPPSPCSAPASPTKSPAGTTVVTVNDVVQRAVLVSNLPPSLDEDGLRSLLKAVETPMPLELTMVSGHRENGRKKEEKDESAAPVEEAVALLVFDTNNNASSIVESLDGRMLGDRELKLQQGTKQQQS